MNGLPASRTIPAAELPVAVERFHDEGWRFVTATAVPRPGAWTLIYHFEREEVLSHLRIEVGLTEAVPAIDRSYPAAFLVENEISELQGVRFSDLSIDYGGRLYRDFDGPEGWVHVRAPGSGESVAPICAAGERER